MLTTQEARQAAGIPSSLPTDSPSQAADGERFGQEMEKAGSQTQQQMIEKLLKRLAAEIPGGSINKKGDEAVIRAEGNVTIAISSTMMEFMGANEEQFAKIKELVANLVDAGREQQLVPAGGSDIRRNITIEDGFIRYVEVQRTAKGAQLSTSAISFGQDGADALNQARESGAEEMAGFQGLFSPSSSSWRFEAILSKQAMANVSSSSEMEIIIQQWAASGKTAQVDVWSYMQMAGLCDPLVLDLGDEGFNMKSAENGVYFDIKGDGAPVRTGFIQGNNAFLYLDQNNNGVVDDVNELFGDHGGAANGFDNLAQYDDNGDGVIDKNDAVYGNLRLWRDLNGDGVNQQNESITLAEAGIKSLNLGYQKNYEMDRHGNVIGERSSFERSDGSKGQMADLWFRNLS